MPIIVGVLGLLKKGVDQNLGKIAGTININELQKMILLGSACMIIQKISVHPTPQDQGMGPSLRGYKKQFTALGTTTTTIITFGKNNNNNNNNNK